MQIAQYKIKYSNTNNNNKRVIISRDKINSTKKWVEYSLDIHDMSKLLIQTKDLNDKFALMNAIDVAQRKKDWHYKQDNFNIKTASIILQAALKAQQKVL